MNDTLEKWILCQQKYLCVNKIVSSVTKRLVTVFVHIKVLYSYFYLGKQSYLCIKLDSVVCES